MSASSNRYWRSASIRRSKRKPTRGNESFSSKTEQNSSKASVRVNVIARDLSCFSHGINFLSQKFRRGTADAGVGGGTRHKTKTQGNAHAGSGISAFRFSGGHSRFSPSGLLIQRERRGDRGEGAWLRPAQTNTPSLCFLAARTACGPPPAAGFDGDRLVEALARLSSYGLQAQEALHAPARAIEQAGPCHRVERPSSGKYWSLE